ncbi:MAG: N-acetyl-gamma-glutamyl-phosphate reductase [Polyangia bacterium]
MIRVAIVGATGYSGGELCVLLTRHAEVELVCVQGSAGRKPTSFESLHPLLRGRTGPSCGPYSEDAIIASGAEVVFLATPNETSADIAPRLLSRGLRVIDLSGAFRLADPVEHERWYGFPRARSEAFYSVPELLDDAGRDCLRAARLVANPGCYATSVILALAPLASLLHPTEAVIADCKSGASGAGKRSELAYSFSELAGNFKAYGTTGHRHEPEIRHAVGMQGAFVFVPHLLPVVRGILSTMYVPLARDVDAAEIARLYAVYAQARHVGVRPHGELPQLMDVVNTPRCELGFQLLPGRRLLVVSVLDNLLKGAASQAVQQLDLAYGFPDLL